MYFRRVSFVQDESVCWMPEDEDKLELEHGRQVSGAAPGWRLSLLGLGVVSSPDKPHAASSPCSGVHVS